MATRMRRSSGVGMASFLALLTFAGTASTGQSDGVGRADGALRLPTPAGNAVAEVSGTVALDFGELGDDDFGPRLPSAIPGHVIRGDSPGSATFEWRDMKVDDDGYRGQRDWRFRGSLTQEDVVVGTTDWRFGAWISREF